MQSPRRERVAEQFAGDQGREDDGHQHSGREPEVAGRFQRDERHGQRPADHGGRQRAHADDRVDIRIELETRQDRIDAGRKQVAAERAQKQCGEEQPTAEAGSQRYHRRNDFQGEHHRDHRQWNRDKSGKMHRPVARRHHLRRHQCEQADHQTAQRVTQRRPQSTVRQERLAQRHATHDGDANQRGNDPEQASNDKIAPEDHTDRGDADAERQFAKCMGDEIAGDRSDANRRQAGRRISADHEFERIEGAGQRRPERARDRGGGAAADHDALIATAQMKGAAERGGEAARQLGVARLQSDRGADAAGPHGLQRHDQAAAKRHPPAMQGIGLDRIDLARRPPARQQQERDPQQQPAEARHQNRAQRFDPKLARKAVPPFKVEQHHVQPLDEGAHRRHHQSADDPDQQRQDHQVRFMRANKGPQPARRFKISR